MRIALVVAALTWLLVGASPIAAQSSTQATAKQVFLVVDGDRLVASNVRTSGFDEMRLNPREEIRQSKEGEGVIVVVTTQRILAYGVVSGWRAEDRIAGERLVSISAADYAGLVVTNKRLINFNGETGVFGERSRRTGI